MKYRQDKKTGNTLSILGFGCMRFKKNSKGIDMELAEELILKAVDGGINYFDTAYIYPGSESALGKIIKKNDIRQKMNIATKLPLALCRSGNDFEKYFSEQLKRLETDYIDYYLMHMLADNNTWEKLCGWGIKQWLAEKKAKGQIKRVGFSFHGYKDEFIKLVDAYDWNFCQVQYNYSDENFQAGIEGIRYAYSKNMPVIIMEPLLGGRLVNNLPKKVTALFSEAEPAFTPAEWALKWIWNQPEPAVVLSGMNEIAQLEENLKLAANSDVGCLDESKANTILNARQIMNELKKVPCTGCSYCMPCPNGVNIPGCFSAYNEYYSVGKITGYMKYLQGNGGFADKPKFASRCKKCGLCEKHCPQSIKIMSELDEVKKKLEPFYVKPIYGIVRKYTKGKNKAKRT